MVVQSLKGLFLFVCLFFTAGEIIMNPMKLKHMYFDSTFNFILKSILHTNSIR